MRTVTAINSENDLKPGALNDVVSSLRRRPSRSQTEEQRTILVVSEDTEFIDDLRLATKRGGRTIAQVKAQNAIEKIRVRQPGAVLLDLDTPSKDAWDLADSLLAQQDCPPLLLLTAHSGHIGIRAAICTGTAADKTNSPVRLLQLLENILTAPHADRIDRAITQRIIVRWLRPAHWSIPVTPAPRYWGINE